MAEQLKQAPFPLLGDADPVPNSLLSVYPEQADTLLLLYEISREFTAILDREELLRRVAQRLKKLVNYQVFSVMLWNEKTQLLESVFAMRNEDSVFSRLRLPLHQGITGTAAGERRTIRVDEVAADPRYIHCDFGIGTRSELVVPLLLQDRLIGVMDLESSHPRAFTAQHERMLGTLGSYIAIALENSRLYEDARVNERRLQDDLDTAREIQRQLLPRGAREVPGLELAAAYVPARELGGDFYDFLPYGQGRIALALGDVSGKGTAAALYGSLAIGMLRELVVDNAHPPAAMLATMNRRLHAARLDARFIAMLFAVYDAPSRLLTFANGGGPYPLLVRGCSVEQIRMDGLPLGMFPQSEYEEISVELRPGDVVVFASDGIHESQNAELEEFGHQRLNELLRCIPLDHCADIISQRILSATDNHAGPGVPPHDDRTLLVLRAKDASASDYSKLPVIY
jgi:phosphoserine phosphatase RsbU/P